MRLREYQTEIINNVRSAFVHKNKRVLAVLPCGAGKTLCFADMCEKHVARNNDNYVWFLVHRKELVNQTIETFEKFNLSLNNVLIAMVQSVSRNISKYRKPSLIIFDEAHHATASTWLNIINAYPDVPVVGLTATPIRLNGKPLNNVFDVMVKGVDAQYLIDNKFLAPFTHYAPKINLEDAQYKVDGNDYDLNDVSEQFDKKAIYGDVIKYINLDKQTIIYCPTIEFSKRLENEINGYFTKRVAKHFDGSTIDTERTSIVDEFKRGELRVLLNVDLVGEGFDVPACDVVMLLRPTMSTALYIQQSMRALRYQENKRAIIYDFVGNVFRHGMITDERDYKLDAPLKMRNSTDDKEFLVRECKDCLRVYKGTHNICAYCGNDNGKTKTQIKIEQDAKLEEIKSLQRKEERMQVGRARDFASLVELAKSRGYANPTFWARKILVARDSKSRKI